MSRRPACTPALNSPGLCEVGLGPAGGTRHRSPLARAVILSPATPFAGLRASEGADQALGTQVPQFSFCKSVLLQKQIYVLLLHIYVGSHMQVHQHMYSIGKCE